MTQRRIIVPWGPSDVGGPLGSHINHDERSKNFLAPMAARVTPLKLKTHRHYGGPLNQENIGACVGFTGAGYLNCKPHRPVGRRLFTAQDAFTFYSETTKIDPFDGTWHYPPPPGRGEDTGTDALSLCKTLKNLGLVKSYGWAFGLEQVLQALMLNPVMLGISWHEGFDTPNAKGVVKFDGRFRGRHEILLVGLDPKLKLVKALNSWGKWGLNGYFYFSFDDLGALLERQGDAVVPAIV